MGGVSLIDGPIDADRCVVCGEVIPEGRQVCPKCVTDSTATTHLYAIKHKKSGRIVTGTDFNYSPPRQILSDYDAPILFTDYNLLHEITRRKVSMRYYTIVKVMVEERK
jgi:uncharacterized OB-fold protein